MMPKYWITVARRDHVKRGITGGFMQICHGKEGPLRRMKGGDWVLYYSPMDYFGEKRPCRQFSTIGIIHEKNPYSFKMSADFIPWRQDISFLPAKETSHIAPDMGINIHDISSKF